MTFYILEIKNTTTLQEAVRNDGVIVFKSATLDLVDADGGWDNTALNLVNAAGDIILVIAIRRRQQIVVFNNKPAGGSWTSEEIIPFSDQFSGPGATVTVVSHPDRFQILFDNKTVHYFNKRGNDNDVTSVAYTINADQGTSLFADNLGVTTYASLPSLTGNN